MNGRHRQDLKYLRENISQTEMLMMSCPYFKRCVNYLFMALDYIFSSSTKVLEILGKCFDMKKEGYLKGFCWQMTK